jgi:ATP-dependent DNA helicase RecG
VSIRNAIFREVCSNLLIHREFSNAFPAKLIIERDHVRTENSNRPHGYGEIDPTDFSPFPKNPFISKFFREIGLADELGSGFKNLNHYVPLYSGDKPHLYEGDIFKVTVPIPDWKAAVAVTDQATTTATTQDTTQVTTQVTTQDKMEMILSFCSIPRSRVEIQAYLGMKNSRHFANAYLTPLIRDNHLYMTIPDKPTSRNQKYVTKTSLSE